MEISAENRLMEILGIPELSVVMPMFNAEQFLHPALASLAAQQLYIHWEVVIGDNGSTDRSREIAESYRDRFPSLTIVDASDRRGRSHAINVAVQASRGRSLVFFDADDVLAPGYLLAMSRALRAEELVCARREIEGLNARRTWAIRPSSQIHGPMNSFGFLPFGGGGTLGVTRRLFDELAGFDTSLMLEDVDFCWRAQLDGGVRLAFVPAAVLHHRYRDDDRAVFRQTRLWGREQAKLRRMYEARGMPRRHPLAPVRELWLLLRRVSTLRDPARRYMWFRRAGINIGRIEGRVRQALRRRTRPPGIAQGLSHRTDANGTTPRSAEKSRAAGRDARRS
jgi:glycosyltransferase involved in cell wall biosynthesis